MRDLPRQTLCELVVEYGLKLSENPKLCRALLNDLCPGYKLEINSILVALEEQIAIRLLAWQQNSPIEILLNQSAKRLEEDRGFKPDVAYWTVETWALALGKITVPHTKVTPEANPQSYYSFQETTNSKTSGKEQKSVLGKVETETLPNDEQKKKEEPYSEPFSSKHIYTQTKVDLINYPFNFMVLDVTGKLVSKQTKETKQFFEVLSNEVILEMVQIPSGEFLMGSPPGEFGRLDNETPQHYVRVPTFYLSKNLITQRQWQTITGSNPSYFRGDNLPVEQISWHQAVEFCQQLSLKTNKLYRLPTEAEWEYACRATTTTPFAFGEIITPKFVNYDSQYPYNASVSKAVSIKRTSAVGILDAANGFGLYDMHGNVWEWCLDAYQNNYLDAPVDGTAKEETEGQVRRVLRGGAWISPAKSCRSASRSKTVPEETSNIIGFRVAVIP